MGMPSLALAARHRKTQPLEFSGVVTDAKATEITVKGKTIKTFNVPSRTPINGSPSGLSALIGKHVTVKEKSPGIAREISVKGAKGGKSSSASGASPKT